MDGRLGSGPFDCERLDYPCGSAFLSPLPPSSLSRAEAVAEVLTDAFSVGLVDLMAEPIRLARTAPDRPVGSPVARQQLRSGAPMVTNLRHTRVRVDQPSSRDLLALLDGTRDRAALGRELSRSAEEIDRELDALARLGLITAPS